MSNRNEHCLWRIELAKQICHMLTGYAGIQAVVVAGSVARGYADEYSDLEIPIFWDKLPDQANRKNIAKMLGTDFFCPFDSQKNEDNLTLNGFRIDLWHITVEEEETVVQSVTQEYCTDLGTSNAMDTIRTCIPLYGEQIVNAWKERAKQYPEQLAIKSIEESLASVDCASAWLNLHRQNPTMLYESIAQLQKNMFLLLLALNGAFSPTFKWMYRSLAELKNKPDRIEYRFRKAFSDPPQEAFEDTIRVLTEVFDLIRERYPMIDTSAAFNRLQPVRTPHTCAPFVVQLSQ